MSEGTSETPPRDPARKRAGLYARVSTTDQDAGVQLRELRALAERRGWPDPAEYADQGVSGTRDRRPELDRLLSDARAGRLHVIVVWALDRLGRSLRHLLALVEELDGLGVDLVVATQPIDTTTPTGRLTFQILGAVAQYERELIRERVRAGVAKARASGKHLGRPQRWTRDQVERAGQLRGAGASWRTIAQSVGLPVRTVRRALAVAKSVPA